MTRRAPAVKKAYHHGDLRQVLLDDAARLLREQGENGLSMRNLATRAGVSRTAAYHHFASKNELLCAVAEEGFRRFRIVFQSPDGDTEDSVNRRRIERFVTDYVNFANDNSEYYDLMFGSQLWQSDALTDTLTREAHGTFRDYVEGIRCWQKAGEVVATLDPLRYARVSFSTLHGMSRLLIDGIYVDDKSARAMCRDAADMLWRELSGE